MAGNENGRIVSSVMAGVAFAVEGDRVGFATESYAASALYTTLASLSGALWRIRRASVENYLNRRRGHVLRRIPEIARGVKNRVAASEQIDVGAHGKACRLAELDR